MKKILILLVFFFSVVGLFAQEHGVSYQALVIDIKKASGMGDQYNYLPNKEMIVRLTIFNVEGNIDYQEEHVTQSNESGIINLVIGKGIPTSQSPIVDRTIAFREISWEGKDKKLKVELSMDKSLNAFYEVQEQDLHFVAYAYHRNITAAGTMDIEGVSNLNHDLFVNNESATTLSGTLDVVKETDLNGNLTVNAESFFNKEVQIDASVSGDYTDVEAYPLSIENAQDGMAIKINGNRSGENSFITFFDGEGVHGQIAGQTNSEVAQDPEFIYTNVMSAAQIVAQAINIGIAVAGLVPTFGISGIKLAIEIVGMGFLVADVIAYNVFAFQNVGVTYSSGSGDYAEWLPLIDSTEQIKFGEVVGVYGGKISKNTVGAEQLLIVSKSPILLGNTPQRDEQLENGKSTAFMGQVPVWVVGKVNQGDYLLAYESGSGLAVAVSPKNLTVDMASRIIGKAWESNESETRKLVMVVVGLQTSEWFGFLKENENKLNVIDYQVNQLQKKVTTREELLNQLVPNYKEAVKEKKLQKQETISSN